jgi:hypothetical protein
LGREDEVNSERPAAPSDVREQVVRFGELPQKFMNLVDDDRQSRNMRRVLDCCDALTDELRLPSTNLSAQPGNRARHIGECQIGERHEVMGQSAERAECRTALEIDPDKLELGGRVPRCPINDK